MEMLESGGLRLTCEPVMLELHWGPIPQAAVWPLLIILAPIGREDHPRLAHRVKAVQIEAFIAHRPVKALLIAILPGAAWIDIQGRRLVLHQPAPHSQGDKLWPVVTAQKLWRAMLAKQAIQNRQHLGRRHG